MCVGDQCIKFATPDAAILWALVPLAKRLERLLSIETCVGRVVKCERGLLGFLWDCWDLVLVVGAIVLGWVVGCLGCPARLFAPVALALALSRCCWVFGGEGVCPPALLPSTLGFLLLRE